MSRRFPPFFGLGTSDRSIVSGPRMRCHHGRSRSTCHVLWIPREKNLKIIPVLADRTFCAPHTVSCTPYAFCACAKPLSSMQKHQHDTFYRRVLRRKRGHYAVFSPCTLKAFCLVRPDVSWRFTKKFISMLPAPRDASRVVFFEFFKQTSREGLVKVEC